MNSIQLILRKGWITRKFTIKVDNNDTIASLKSKLSTESGLDGNSMKIIFCGRKLEETTSVESLRLSPQTNLIVTVPSRTKDIVQECQQGVSNTSIEQPDSFTKVYSSFYVYCKKCGDLKRGKLRAYCSECKSSMIIFNEQPTGWSDVLGYKKLNVDCKECNCAQTASIIFKCVECSEGSIPLTHIRRNVIENELDFSLCEVCSESDFPQYLTFSGCSHKCCVDCFKAYCAQMMAHQNFVMKLSTGFTVTCPVYRCPGYISDVHHFYLLGVESYQQFHRQAAELFVVQHSERQYCPAANCNAVFLNTDTDDENENLVLCPDCSKLFCRRCRMGNCICNEKLENASLQTVRETSKFCPLCKAPTERNGGCAHIHCTQCKHEWCYICGNEWSDECQWDHWFE